MANINVQQKLESMTSLRNLLWNSTAPIVIRTLWDDVIVAADPDPVRIYSILCYKKGRPREESPF